MTTSAYLLALETSGHTASVALLNPAGPDAKLVGDDQVPAGQRSAKLLVPTVRTLLQNAGVTPGDIAALAVTVGPGSFTGLRVGVTTAKTFAYATGCQLVAVNTLEVLARQTFAAGVQSNRVWAVIDAQRDEVFAACYKSQETVGEQGRTELLSGVKWLERLQTGDLVVGPVVAKYADGLPEGVGIAGPEACTPTAATVGQIASELLAEGKTCDPFALVPEYHRLSAAEEKARGAGR